MSVDIQQVTEAWKVDEPRFQALGKLVQGFIKLNITECEIMPDVSHRTKELLSIVKKIKKKSKEKAYSYDSLNDKLGVRIICTFNDDLSKVDGFLRKYFTVKNVDYKRDALDFDKLDYISNHYDLSTKGTTREFSKCGFDDLVFEVQVRTLNQHAWSNTAHSLSYKQEAELSSSLKRKVYRLLSLYEIADDEFTLVNNALKSDPDNQVYQLLRSLEGKTYKYAQVDFDRETSLMNLKTIIGWFETHRDTIVADLESFIKRYDSKIKGIFDQNRFRFHEIPFITQPEVFLIWYGLDNVSPYVEDNWGDTFDHEELEQLKSLWGKIID